MTLTAPIFWYHQSQRAHELPDARSDAKGRTVLRKIRAGYANISPQHTGSPEPTLPEPTLPEPTPSQESTPSEPPPSEPTGQEPTQLEPVAEAEDPAAAVDDDQQRATPPDYESLEPPPYAQPLPSTPSHSPPEYSALPGVASEPARDLKQPVALRRRYRDALRRRLSSTRKRFGSDGHERGVDTSEDDEEGEAARGVVLCRGHATDDADDDDEWVGMMDELKKEVELLPRQRGVRGWFKRVWKSFVEWSQAHPHWFILAMFVIAIVAMALLI